MLTCCVQWDGRTRNYVSQARPAAFIGSKCHGRELNMKNLIVVGNKQMKQNLSEKIDKFDFVIRINRMNNYGNAGIKTDLLAVDPHNEFFNLVEKPFDKFNNAKKLIINTFFFSLKTAIMLLQRGIFRHQ